MLVGRATSGGAAGTSNVIGAAGAWGRAWSPDRAGCRGAWGRRATWRRRRAEGEEKVAVGMGVTPRGGSWQEVSGGNARPVPAAGFSSNARPVPPAGGNFRRRQENDRVSSQVTKRRERKPSHSGSGTTESFDLPRPEERGTLRPRPTPAAGRPEARHEPAVRRRPGEGRARQRPPAGRPAPRRPRRRHPAWEVVFVDDGSTDGTFAELRSWRPPTTACQGRPAAAELRPVGRHCRPGSTHAAGDVDRHDGRRPPERPGRHPRDGRQARRGVRRGPRPPGQPAGQVPAPQGAEPGRPTGSSAR